MASSKTAPDLENRLHPPSSPPPPYVTRSSAAISAPYLVPVTPLAPIELAHLRPPQSSSNFLSNPTPCPNYRDYDAFFKQDDYERSVRVRREYKMARKRQMWILCTAAFLIIGGGAVMIGVLEAGRRQKENGGGGGVY